jgi:hypothetical protein
MDYLKGHQDGGLLWVMGDGIYGYLILATLSMREDRETVYLRLSLSGACGWGTPGALERLHTSRTYSEQRLVSYICRAEGNSRQVQRVIRVYSTNGHS